MGRRPRIDAPGTWHHITNHGTDDIVVFRTRSDGERFEALLHDASIRYGPEIHAYCLMPNHFHLLLHCPDGNLGRFMGFVQSTYSKRFNARTARDGPLFRSRYHDVVVTSPEQLAVAGRYIHRNPIDLDPDRPLAGYRWSSYGAYVGAVPVPPFLRTEVLLEHFSNVATYATYVEAA